MHKNKEIITTGDGSKTIFLKDFDENYHSKHGAYQEAVHVFLKSGLDRYKESFPDKKEIRIFEVGFGTGFNSLLTFFKAKEENLSIYYQGIEAFPLEWETVYQLEYTSQLQEEKEALNILEKLHNSNWEEVCEISPSFQLKKLESKLQEVQIEGTIDLIFFDAFGPRVQPELWEVSIFEKLYSQMSEGAILVTYCCKGQVKRNMISAGFSIEKIPGPPGKREMLRATKK